MFTGKILFSIQTSRLCVQRPVVHTCPFGTIKDIPGCPDENICFLLLLYFHVTPFQNCIYIIYCWFQSGATECDALINRAAQSDWPFLGLRVLALPKNLQVCMNVDSFPYLKN